MYQIDYEFAPGNYITCRVLRELFYRDGTVELLIHNPLTDELEYICTRTR